MYGFENLAIQGGLFVLRAAGHPIHKGTWEECYARFQEEKHKHRFMSILAAD